MAPNPPAQCDEESAEPVTSATSFEPNAMGKTHAHTASVCSRNNEPLENPQTNAYLEEFNLGCEYIRERKKRGKASRKDLAQQAAAAAAAAATSNGQKSP